MTAPFLAGEGKGSGPRMTRQRTTTTQSHASRTAERTSERAQAHSQLFLPSFPSDFSKNLKVSGRIGVYHLILSPKSDDELPVLPTDRTHEQAVKSLLSHSNEQRGGCGRPPSFLSLSCRLYGLSLAELIKNFLSCIDGQT